MLVIWRSSPVVDKGLFIKMSTHTRWESLGHETTSVVRQEWLSGQPQAGAARAPVLGHAGANRVSAVAADEPPILIGDHRSELNACHAIRAAENQGCVGQRWHWAFLHWSKGDWHAGFQTPRRVIPLKTIRIVGSHTVIEPKPAPTFRQACR